MKKILGLLMLAGALMSATQAHAIGIWQGFVKVEATTTQCDNGFTFFAAGEETAMTFLPAGVAGNGSDTIVSIGTSAYFVSMKVVGAGLSSGVPYSTTAIDPFGTLIRKSGIFAIANINPTPFDNTDKMLTVVLRFSNAGGTPGCTVTLRGKLQKKANN